MMQNVGNFHVIAELRYEGATKGHGKEVEFLKTLTHT